MSSNPIPDEKMQESIKNIFSAMIDASNHKAMENEMYKQLMAKPELLTAGRYFGHATGLDEINQAIEVAIDHAFPNMNPVNAFQYKKVFMNHDSMESHVRRLVEQFDGGMCCADKSNTVVGQFLKFMRSDERAEWNAENYWVPDFGTQDQWFEFVAALAHLSMGRPERYFVAYKELLDAGAKDGAIAKYKKEKEQAQGE